MLHKLHHRRGGFTLVEIMIVVAIIALLASIAVPGFLRARKRAQATTILNELRLIDGAKEQYAIEYNRLGSDTASHAMVKLYLKPNTRLYLVNEDIFGNAYDLNTFDELPFIASGTEDEFTDVVDDAFWSPYKP